MADGKKTPKSGGTVLHTWDLTTANPTGRAICNPGASDRTVQFIGANYGGATVVLEWSLDDVVYVTATDGQGNEISFAGDGGEMVAENALFFRPRLIVAGSGAIIQALLLSRSTMR